MTNLTTYHAEKETIQEYIDRLCLAKDAASLTWRAIQRLVEENTGVHHSDKYYRRRAERLESKSETALEKTDSNTPESMENRLKELIQDLRVERVKVADERAQLSADVRKISREQTLKEIASLVASDVKERVVPYTIHPQNVTEVSDNEAILAISDWHYGIEIDNAFNQYSPAVLINRVNELKDKVIDTCQLYDVTKLHILNLGDMIAGKIHLPLRINSRCDVISQVIHVSEIIAQMLEALTAAGIEVFYYSCSDNHSRIDENKKEAINLESLARITPWYLKERVRDNDFIHIEDNEFGEDIITLNVNDFMICGVHGDKDKIETVVPKIVSFTRVDFDLMMTAHRHHFAGDEHTKTVVLSNGSLMGTDEYAVDLRLQASPSQNMIIVGKDDLTKCIRRITVD